MQEKAAGRQRSGEHFRVVRRFIDEAVDKGMKAERDDRGVTDCDAGAVLAVMRQEAQSVAEDEHAEKAADDGAPGGGRVAERFRRQMKKHRD